MAPSEEEEVATEPARQPPPTQQPDPSTTREPTRSWSSIIATVGIPCLIGVAAIDPGNMEVDLQAGATLGYHLIWALLLSSVLGCILQTLSAHVAIATGLHLAEVCSRIYSHDKFVSNTVFIITMLSIVSFDVAEVIGTAFSIQMLFGVPLWLGMVLSACDTMFVLWLQRTGLSRIELVVEGLLFILAGCVVYEFILSGPSYPAILKGAFIPSFGENTAQGIVLAVSIMGSLLMSHNLFLHSWLEKQRQTARANDAFGQPHAAPTGVTEQPATSNFTRACRYAGLESSLIYMSCFLINSCLLVVAATLPSDAVPEVGELGLMQAGGILEKVLGQKLAATAWAIALLASGHAATVTGALASQAVCEGFLNIRDGQSSSLVIMVTRSIAIIPAVFAALIAGEKGSDGLVVASQTVLAFALPFAAVPLFKVLDVVARVKPGYGRRLLHAGYFVFSIDMVANVYAIWQVGRAVLIANGMFSFAIFMVVVVILCTAFFRLLFTPIDVRSFAVVGEQTDAKSEYEELLPDNYQVYNS